MTVTTDVAAPPQLLYKIPEVVRALRMSRSEIYKQIRARRISTVKQGHATFITADDLAAYVELLKQEAEAGR